ncbi:ParB-like nuclease domain-containing protein [Dyella ginsengisoli]|uniref:ParB-like nuclease domain-containing protein n=1 Tax=Dyella ginsengisoli TaxID=363848 RepID=A0ABW8JVD0_9GAMM
MNIEQALQRLQSADVQMLPLAELKTDDTFQPREVRMVPFREQAGVERRSEDHIAVMRLALEAAQGTELEPVLVADVQGSRYVVDGHHRLTAYRRAQRETIPARVMPMDRAQAVLVSKLVNCAGRALEMHAEQRRDAAWQYLAAVTKRGAVSLPTRESTRTVGALFSVSHSTVARMLRKLPEVNPRDWSTAAFDPGTGFPRWRYVREAGAGWQDMKERLDVEQLTQHEAEKFARKVGALIEKTSPEAVRRAWQMLGIEAQLEAVNEDMRDFAADTAESMDF